MKIFPGFHGDAGRGPNHTFHHRTHKDGNCWSCLHFNGEMTGYQICLAPVHERPWKPQRGCRHISSEACLKMNFSESVFQREWRRAGFCETQGRAAWGPQPQRGDDASKILTIGSQQQVSNHFSKMNTSIGYLNKENDMQVNHYRNVKIKMKHWLLCLPISSVTSYKSYRTTCTKKTFKNKV